jgi:hypothetical protein
MLDIDVKNGQNLTRHSQIFLPIAIVRQAASRFRAVCGVVYGRAITAKLFVGGVVFDGCGLFYF